MEMEFLLRHLRDRKVGTVKIPVLPGGPYENLPPFFGLRKGDSKNILDFFLLAQEKFFTECVLRTDRYARWDVLDLQDRLGVERVQPGAEKLQCRVRAGMAGSVVLWKSNKETCSGFFPASRFFFRILACLLQTGRGGQLRVLQLRRF